MKRKLAAVLAAVALCVLPGVVHAQAYPNKPIKIFIGFAPGSGVDIAARTVANFIERELQQPVVVDYRIGGGGTVAANVVAKADPDGYTLLVTEHGSVVYMDLMMKGLPYNPYRDFAIASPIFRASFILVAGSGMKVGITSLEDLIAEAKANPGKIAYGHSGIGTSHHLTMELLKQKAGIDMISVAYKGSAHAVIDVVSGQVPMIITSQTVTDQYINAGKIRGLAVSSDTRWQVRPNLPTISETIPGFVSYTYASMFAPAKTPREILVKLNAAVTKGLNDAETAKTLNSIGLEPRPASLELSNQTWQAERKQWEPVIKALGLKLD